MRLFKGFFIILLIFGLNTSYAAKPSWMDLIAQGKDKEAAEALNVLIDKLPTNADLDYKTGILRDTSYLLEHSHKVTDQNSVILFRGVTLGDSDYYTKGKKPFFPSKALMSGRKFRHTNIFPVRKFKNYKHKPFGNLTTNFMRSHGESTHRYPESPFISTAIDPETAALSETIIVLKIHPDRTFVNYDSPHHYEFEVLVPLYIHPNEVMAIIHRHDPKEKPGKNLEFTEPSFYKGDFDIIYNGEKGTSDKALKSKLITLMKQKKYKQGTSADKYTDRFLRQTGKALKSAKYSIKNRPALCQELFMNSYLNSLFD